MDRIAFKNMLIICDVRFLHIEIRFLHIIVILSSILNILILRFGMITGIFQWILLDILVEIR